MRRGWFLLGACAVMSGTAWGSAVLQAIERDPAVVPARFTLRLDQPIRYRLFTLDSPARVVVDLLDTRIADGGVAPPSPGGAVGAVRVGQRSDGAVRLVLDLVAPVAEPVARLQTPPGGALLTIDLLPPGDLHASVRAPAAGATAPSLVPAQPAAPAVATERAEAGNADAAWLAARAAETAGGQRPVTIAVDAGHGGHDPGAHGPNGVLEKDVTLQIARRLAETINGQPGMRAILTRDRDEFLPLRGRMERARAAQADLFISVHADAVRNRDVRGASVYVLNEKGATDEAARRLAARENAADLVGGVSLGDKDPVLASVLMDVSQNASLSSSITVGDAILRSMTRVGLVRKQRVLQAPFMVLKSPDVPSVLIETAYISNPQEEQNLDDDGYRRKLAGAIFAGVARHFRDNPPSRFMVAAAAPAVAPAAPAPRSARHVVQPGETLASVAGRYNVSVSDIRQANRLRGDRVVAGRVLRIPLAQGT